MSEVVITQNTDAIELAIQEAVSHIAGADDLPGNFPQGGDPGIYKGGLRYGVDL